MRALVERRLTSDEVEFVSLDIDFRVGPATDLSQLRANGVQVDWLDLTGGQGQERVAQRAIGV